MKTKLNRRSFLKRSLTGTAGIALAPTIIPSSALGLGGAVPPSERIVLGGIGIGGRGTHVLSTMLPEKDVQFVAICDPQKSRREAVKKLVTSITATKTAGSTKTSGNFWRNAPTLTPCSAPPATAGTRSPP